MKVNLQLVAAALTVAMGLNAQVNSVQHRKCGTQPPPAEWDAWMNQKVQEYKENIAAGRAQKIAYTIPVIVHVIHGGQGVGSYPNLPSSQINSQISVLNADFGGTGFNVSQLAATAFSAIGAAQTDILFCAATKDPNGATLASPGIDRVNYVTQGWSDPASFNTTNGFQNFINNTVKPATIWDPTRYLNIWVSDCSNQVGLLGYATFPMGSGLTGLGSNYGTAQTDGIWVWSAAYGNTGLLAAPFDKGRTATHEIGHWLGLRHIGGDGNGNPSGDCNASDFCTDTPPQLGGFGGGSFGQNYGGPSYPLNVSSCSGAPDGDMFMNFMDYTDDAYMYMFTPDQSARFQTCMQNGTFRTMLSTSANTLCLTTGIESANSMFDNNVTLFPNPSNGKVNISVAFSSSNSIDVEVYNALGQVISKTKHEGVKKDVLSLDLSNSNPGVYFVSLSNGTDKVVKRLVISE